MATPFRDAFPRERRTLVSRLQRCGTADIRASTASGAEPKHFTFESAAKGKRVLNVNASENCLKINFQFQGQPWPGALKSSLPPLGLQAFTGPNLLSWSVADVSDKHLLHKTPAPIRRPFASCFGLDDCQTQRPYYLRPHRSSRWAGPSLTSLGATMR